MILVMSAGFCRAKGALGLRLDAKTGISRVNEEIR